MVDEDWATPAGPGAVLIMTGPEAAGDRIWLTRKQVKTFGEEAIGSVPEIVAELTVATEISRVPEIVAAVNTRVPETVRAPEMVRFPEITRVPEEGERLIALPKATRAEEGRASGGLFLLLLLLRWWRRRRRR
jgi:hypothetical protein